MLVMVQKLFLKPVIISLFIPAGFRSDFQSWKVLLTICHRIKNVMCSGWLKNMDKLATTLLLSRDNPHLGIFGRQIVAYLRWRESSLAQTGHHHSPSMMRHPCASKCRLAVVMEAKKPPSYAVS